MKLDVHIRLLQDTDHGGVMVDEYQATYELESTQDSTIGLMDRFRTLLRRELIRMSLIVPTPDDLKRKR